MSTPTIPGLGGCGRPASGRIEGFSAKNGLLHGSLDLGVYVCPEHTLSTAAAMRDAGLTPVALALRPGTDERCGAGWDYRTGQRIAALEPTSTAITAVQVPAVTAGPEGTEHPVWCALVTDDGPCADVEYHASAWIAVDSEENDAPGIEVQLTTAGGLAVVIRYLYEDELTTQILPLEQAARLAAVLVDLVGKARGGGR